MSPLVTPGIGLIFWTSVVFIVLLVVLKKFAWTGIMEALKERSKFIQDSLDSADKAQEEMKALQASNENLLQEARIERDKMFAEAKTTINQLHEESKESATAEYTKIVESAKDEIERQKNEALADVRNQVAEFSLQIAEKLVRKNLDNEGAQKQLIETYLKEAKLN
jgi:F-type H+-transporting ATPase subunit b